jgi:hypothetical protein
MGARCRCGSEVHFHFNHLGCIQCGYACCPACSLEVESVAYCLSCAEALFDVAGIVPRLAWATA